MPHLNNDQNPSKSSNLIKVNNLRMGRTGTFYLNFTLLSIDPLPES